MSPHCDGVNDLATKAFLGDDLLVLFVRLVTLRLDRVKGHQEANRTVALALITGPEPHRIDPVGRSIVAVVVAVRRRGAARNSAEGVSLEEGAGVGVVDAVAEVLESGFSEFAAVAVVEDGVCGGPLARTAMTSVGIRWPG